MGTKVDALVDGQPDPREARSTRGGRGFRLARALRAGVNRRRPGGGRERKEGLSMISMLRELWAFMRVRKKWWLGPIFVTMIFLSALIALTEGSAVAPLIYALF